MTSAGVLRQMTAHDLSAVMDIEKRAYPFPWTRGIFEDCIRVGYTCWVLEQKSDSRATIVGYMILSIAVGEMHILNICIDPNSQKQGIGRALLEDAEAYGRKNKATMCFLEVRPSNKAALKLYLSVGFNEVGLRKNYYKDKSKREDAILMAKSL